MHFLRTSRHASAVVVAVVLIVIGVVIGVTRKDPGDHHGVVLRADQQALQPSPTITVPGQVVGHTPTLGTPNGPPLTIGSLGAPIHVPGPIRGVDGGSSTGGSRGATTPTTTTNGSGGAPATTVGSSGAFVPGRIAYTLGNAVDTANPDGSQASAVATGYFAAWSPDHKAIAYADADGQGGGLHVVSAGDNYPLTTGVAKDSRPAWSPDGAKIAFARYDSTQPTDYSEIWVVNRDGTGLKELTQLACFNSDPVWSPDGKKIAFRSSSDHCVPGATQGNYELYVLTVATNTVARLDPAHTTNAGDPAWSPDGKLIAYSCDGEGGIGFEICTITPDGSTKHRLTNLSGNDTTPAWSPDARNLIFHSDRSGAAGLYEMTATGANVQLVTAGAVEPAWY